MPVGNVGWQCWSVSENEKKAGSGKGTTAGAQGRNAIQAKFAIAAKTVGIYPVVGRACLENQAVCFIAMAFMELGWRLEWVRAGATGAGGVRSTSCHTSASNSCRRTRLACSSATSNSQTSLFCSLTRLAARLCRTPVDFCGLIFVMTGPLRSSHPARNQAHNSR